MLSIGNKTFMNLQEAVGWLLENNALPFQSTANYVGNTEIAMSTLVNPSPAKVRVGSLIFFADSKVSTVVGVTSNSFIVSDQFNNLVDDIAYVTGVSINASGHLITTLSDGQTIDAGQIKQISNFSIDGSQHLIANFNDSTTQDLGAIFTGNVNISGTLNATAITGDSIIETMTGYSFSAPSTTAGLSQHTIYAGVSKTGNKLTIVIFQRITRTGTVSTNYAGLGQFFLPSAVMDKLYPTIIDGGSYLDNKVLDLFSSLSSIINAYAYVSKQATYLSFNMFKASQFAELELNKDYFFRYEATFLLSDNLAS